MQKSEKNISLGNRILVSFMSWLTDINLLNPLNSDTAPCEENRKDHNARPSEDKFPEKSDDGKIIYLDFSLYWKNRKDSTVNISKKKLHEESNYSKIIYL